MTALLLAAALLAQAPSRDYRVKTATPRAPAAERIAARADARLDQWLGEQDYEAINGVLQKNKLALPWPAGFLPAGVKPELFELKIISSNRRQTDERTTTLRLRVELGAGRLHKLTHARATFESTPAGWVARRIELEPIVTTQGVRPRFRDVTQRALGRDAAFTQQLARGLDDWRSTLDAASGIDVYGHQGLAAADVDGDGLEDLYVCQPAGLPNRLLRNNGDGTFTDIAARARVDLLDATSMALFADLDHDGDADLLAITSTHVLLFRNDGRGVFTHLLNAGFQPSGATLTGAALADYDRDGFLDLYVCAYDFWTGGATYDAPRPYYDATNGPPNFLYRNRGGLVFEDVTQRSGLNVNNDRFSFAASWADYDRDGFPDLYVANDFGRNNLYRNNGDGTFTDVARAAGVEDLGAGMSASWGDYDGDGWPDLYVSNMWSSAGQRLTFHPDFAQRVARDPREQAAFQSQARGNSLFRNQRDGTFADVSKAAGVEFGRWAWGSGFLDYDNDGRLDLFVTNGYVTGPDTHDL